MIKNTRDELIHLKEEIELMHGTVSGQKQSLLQDISESVKQVKNWSLLQIGEIKDSIESTKLRAEGAIEDVRNEVETKIDEYQKGFDLKIAAVIKDSDTDISAKRNEIRGLTAEMLRQMNEKEKELSKKTERMNKIVDEAVDKTNEELSGIKIGIEQKFDQLYKTMEQKGEAGLDKFRLEMNAVIEDYSRLVEQSKDDVIGLREGSEDIRKKIEVQKDSILKELNISLKEAKEWIGKEIQGIKNEIEGTKLRAEGVFDEVRNEVETRIDEYHKDFDSKLTVAMKESDSGLASKREEIRSLTEVMLRQMNEKEKDLAKKTERMNKIIEDAVAKTNDELLGIKNGIEQKFDELYDNIENKGDSGIENLKNKINSMMEDYSRLIEQSKEDVMVLREGTEDIRKKIETQKDTILKELAASLKEAKEWNMRELQGIKDEIENTKLRAEGVIEEVRNEVETKIDEYHKDFDSKLTVAMKESDTGLASKREEIRSLTEVMLRQMNEKEKELTKKTERMNKMVEDALDNTNNELLILRNGFEQKFNEFYQSLEQKGEAGLDKFKLEMRAMMEDYSRLIEQSKDDVIVLREGTEDIRKRIEAQKDSIMKELAASLKEAKEWNVRELQGIKDEIEDTKLRAEGVIEEVRNEVETKIDEYHKDFDSKLTMAMKESDSGLASKREEIRSLTEVMLRQMNEKEKDIAKKTERMNKMVDDALDNTNNELLTLRNGFEQKLEEFFKSMEQRGGSGIENLKIEMDAVLEDYNRIIEKSKDDIIVLKEGTEDIRKSMELQKDSIVLELENSIKEAKQWSGSEIQNIRNEISVTKTRTEGILAEVRNTVDKKVEEFHQEFGLKLNSILKDADEDIEVKKDDIRNITDELIRQVGEKEKELLKKVEKMNDMIESAVDKADDELLNIHKTLEQKFDNTYRELEEKGELGIENAKVEIKAMVDNIKNDALGNMTDLNQKINDMAKTISGQVNQVMELKKNIEGFGGIFSDIQFESEEKIKLINEKMNDLNRFMDTLEKSVAQSHNELEAGIKDSLKEIYGRIDSEKAGISIELEGLKKTYIDFVESLKEEDRKNLVKNADENLKKLNVLMEDYKKDFDKEIEKFKDSFLPPTDEIVNKLSLKAGEIENRFSIKTADYAKNVENYLIQFKNSEENLTEKLEDIIKGYNSKIEEYKKGFTEKADKYIENSDLEFKKIADKIHNMDRELKNFEEKTVESIRNKTLILEENMNKKLSSITINFDEYIRKSEQDFNGAVESTKKEINFLLDDLKENKDKFREEIINDIKELNKRTKEIELRYDSLLKKSSLLDRAEGLADKSNKNIESITQFLKELEARRKEIDASLSYLENIKTEHKELNSILNNIGGSKKEAMMIYQAVTDALQKAKETQELLTQIEKQSAKADNVKTILVETLKIYEEIKNKAIDVENKRDIINKILGSIETSKDEIKNIDGKVSTIEDKIGSINKISKKIDDDIKTAQNNISRLFSDQEKVSYTVDKIVDIENLLVHIEEEAKKVDKMRDWVAKLENRLERIKDTQESSLGGKRAANVDKGSDEDVIKNILRLKEQGWSIEEISSSLKISRAYVELIIERYVE